MARSTPTNWASSGCATVASTTAADAPGYVVVTETCGGTMSGYCASGIATSAIAPAITVTMAMTMARRGRSTKIDDSIASASGCRSHRRSLHGGAGPERAQPLDDHLL